MCVITSWFTNANASSRMCSMLESDPVSRLSTQITRCPSASRCSHRCDPRKPAPPVTTEVGIKGIVGRGRGEDPSPNTTFTQGRSFFFTGSPQVDPGSNLAPLVPIWGLATNDDGARGGTPMENVTLMELVDEVRDLPLTVSAVLAQVISECDNADASVSSLARIMAGDQALAAMVLKLANSAYYGYARK